MPMSVPLPIDADLPPDVVKRLHELPPINIYRMLGHVPQSVIPWTDLIRALYQCQFDMRLREIAIYRQACNAGSSYEIHQHQLIALANHVTKKELACIQTESPVTSLSEEENFICLVADELEKQATLTEATFEKLYKRYGTSLGTELILILSIYSAVSRFLNGTRVPLEKHDVLAGHGNPGKK